MNRFLTEKEREDITMTVGRLLSTPEKAVMWTLGTMTGMRRMSRVCGERAREMAFSKNRDEHQALLEQAAWAQSVANDIDKSGVEMSTLGFFTYQLIAAKDMIQRNFTANPTTGQSDMTEFIPVPATIPGVSVEDFDEFARLLESEWCEILRVGDEEPRTVQGPVSRVIRRLAEAMLGYMAKLEREVDTDDGLVAFENAAENGLYNHQDVCNMIVDCPNLKGPEFEWPHPEDGQKQAETYVTELEKMFTTIDSVLNSMIASEASEASKA